nr:MarR family transcriptional regulator [Desulforadius tongensis]
MAKLDEISRNVLIFVADKSTPDGMLIYPAKDMGKELGYSEFEINQALSRLESQGVIDVREGEDKEQPNVILYKEEWLNKLKHSSQDHHID